MQGQLVYSAEVRKREADETKVPQMPSVTERESWKQAVEEAVCAASNQDDQSGVMTWIKACGQKVDDPQVTFSVEASPQELRSLEAKLGVALKIKVKAGSDRSLAYAIERLSL